MTESRKKRFWSLVTVPINAIVGSVLTHALSNSGVLDPLEKLLGNWIKMIFGMSINPLGIVWAIAALLSLFLYAGTLFFIWKTNKPHSVTSPSALGNGKATPGRGDASPSPPVPVPPPPNVPIKGDYAHLGGSSAAAEMKLPSPTSMVRQGSPTTTEPKATAPYPCLAELDLLRLYAIDRERGKVFLRFRPDGNSVPEKTIELILLGNKVLLDLEETPLTAASYAVQKSNPFNGIFGVGAQVSIAAGASAAELAAGEGMGNRILQVGLASGRKLRLSHDIRESVAEVAADLMRRAD